MTGAEARLSGADVQRVPLDSSSLVIVMPGGSTLAIPQDTSIAQSLCPCVVDY